MTITISQQAWQDLQQKVDETALGDPLDPLDVTWQYPKSISWVGFKQSIPPTLNL